jgi:hypothetical protein
MFHLGILPSAANSLPERIQDELEKVMKMLWGKRRGCGTFGAVQQTDGAPHVATF